MSIFNRISKNTNQPDEDHSSLFLIVVAGAAMLLTCFLIYALVAPTLFDDNPPEYEVVPYSTETPQPAQPVALPTTEIINPPVPTAIPAATQPPTERINPQTAQRVNRVYALAGHSSAVSSVTFSPNGQFLVSGDLDGLIKLWDARNYTEIYTFQSSSNRVDSVAFSPDGSQLAAAGQDTQVRRWDLANGVEIAPLTGPANAINSLAFSPTGALLAAASDDGFVYLWNMPGGTLLGKLQGHTSYVTSIALNPNGSVLAAGGEDDTVRLWSIPNGVSYGVMTGHTSSVVDVAFSPDGNTLVTTSADRTVRLWDVLSLSQIRLFSGHTENINSVTFSPDGLLIASAAGGITDNTVRLWDTATGAQVGVLYPDGPANSVAFSPSGVYLATGGATYLSIWSVTNTTQPAAQQPQTPAGAADGQGGFADPTTAAGDLCYLTVRVDDVNVRSGPGVNYLYMSTINRNTTVQAVGWARGIDGDGFTWWRANDGGWIRGDVFIDAANPNLPDACWTLSAIVAIPPTPDATLPFPSQTPAFTNLTPAGPCVLTVYSQFANVRSGAGTDNPVSGQVLHGQTVQAIGWTTGPEFFTWWQLNTGGWGRGDAFLDAVNTSVPDACLALPLVGQ